MKILLFCLIVISLILTDKKVGKKTLKPVDVIKRETKKITKAITRGKEIITEKRTKSVEIKASIVDDVKDVVDKGKEIYKKIKETEEEIQDNGESYYETVKKWIDHLKFRVIGPKGDGNGDGEWCVVAPHDTNNFSYLRNEKKYFCFCESKNKWECKKYYERYTKVKVVWIQK